MPWPKPLGPREVTLAGTPGAELKCPPKPIDVTEAGTPLICAEERLTRNKRIAIKEDDVTEKRLISRDIIASRKY
jgi:hypothetical protein